MTRQEAINYICPISRKKDFDKMKVLINKIYDDFEKVEQEDTSSFEHQVSAVLDKQCKT